MFVYVCMYIYIYMCVCMCVHVYMIACTCIRAGLPLVNNETATRSLGFDMEIGLPLVGVDTETGRVAVRCVYVCM